MSNGLTLQPHNITPLPVAQGDRVLVFNNPITFLVTAFHFTVMLCLDPSLYCCLCRTDCVSPLFPRKWIWRPIEQVDFWSYSKSFGNRVKSDKPKPDPQPVYQTISSHNLLYDTIGNRSFQIPNPLTSLTGIGLGLISIALGLFFWLFPWFSISRSIFMSGLCKTFPFKQQTKAVLSKQGSDKSNR